MSIDPTLPKIVSELQSESWSKQGQFSYKELQEIRSIISQYISDYEIIGSGSTRVVLMTSSKDKVYKLNCIPSDSQNRTEVRIWRNGCRNIPHKYLAEVFDWTDSYSVIEMEYCQDLSHMTVVEFEEQLDAIYDGRYEFTDEGAKDSWGISVRDSEFKCRDYGRALVKQDASETL